MTTIEISFGEYLRASQSNLINGVLALMKEKGIVFEGGQPKGKLTTHEDHERNLLIIKQEF